LRNLWENGLAGAGAVALLLGIWLSARGLGLLERPRYALESLYIGPADYVGFSTMPHFMLQINNTGNVPVTFSDFELILPRRDIFRDGSLWLIPGHELSSTSCHPFDSTGMWEHAACHRSRRKRTFERSWLAARSLNLN
jgi:hypothetical protein